MNKVVARYGVNIFINEVHVNSVEFSENLEFSEFKYIVEIVEVEEYNGNGEDEMKIYIDGKLEVIEIGNWKISPVIRMPFNWSGFWDIIEMQDKSSKIINRTGKPDKSSIFQNGSFIKDIRWVFETINALSEIESVEHYELLEHINNTIDIFPLCQKEGTDIETILRIAEMIDFETRSVNTIEISEKRRGLLKLKINETIDLFNNLKLKHVE